MGTIEKPGFPTRTLESSPSVRPPIVSVFPRCRLHRQVLTLFAVRPAGLRRRSTHDAFAQGEDGQVWLRLAQVARRGGHGVLVLLVQKVKH